MRKAVALISGGLDSLLAAKVIMEQGVHVEGLNFYTGFCVEGHTHAIRKHNQTKRKRNNALWVAEQLGIKLHIIDVIEDYKRIVINPKYGYGKYLNPCLDCKIFMVQRAKIWMEENHFDFIITGEVIGQRPKSQRKACMPIVSKQSGAEDRLLRPLCAKLLEPTLPEREGWVEREKLYQWSGRGRHPQIALANQFGFKDYSQPAGGCCFLTNEQYSDKLQDLWEFRGTKEYDIDDIMLLKVGRHLRPQPHFKLIIGREEGENHYLAGYRHRFISLQALEHDGPLVLIDGKPTEDDLQLAARITARFGAGRDEKEVAIEISLQKAKGQIVFVKPLKPDEISSGWYV